MIGSVNVNSEYRIPYDEAPFDQFLQPGNKGTLYGNIEIGNETKENILATVRFDLHTGFVLTVQRFSEPWGIEEIMMEERVPMHSKFEIRVVDGKWILHPSDVQDWVSLSDAKISKDIIG